MCPVWVDFTRSTNQVPCQKSVTRQVPMNVLAKLQEAARQCAIDIKMLGGK
jgi:hypothetical protein